jgi:hypothetical protein
MAVVALCAVTGGGLVLAGHPRLLERLGGVLDGSPVAQEQSAALSSLLVGYGVLFLALALLRALGKPSQEKEMGLRASAGTMWRDMVSAMRSSLASRGDATWLAAIVVVGLVLRGRFLASPMWYDEAYTFLHFVKPGWPLLFDYPLPNNHVLHTILAKLSTLVWGDTLCPCVCPPSWPAWPRYRSPSSCVEDWGQNDRDSWQPWGWRLRRTWFCIRAWPGAIR